MIDKQDMFIQRDDTGHDNKYVRKTQRLHNVSQIVNNINKYKGVPNCPHRLVKNLSTSLETVEHLRAVPEKTHQQQQLAKVWLLRFFYFGFSAFV